MVAKRLLSTGILGAILLCGPATWAERSSYLGAHAIPESISGRFCHIRVAHTHTYPPGETLAANFVAHERAAGQLEFIGDPKELGFQGQAYVYFGAHPMHVHGDIDEPGAACARLEKHTHLTAPSDPLVYEERRGIYYFVSYKEARRASRKAKRNSRRQRAGAPNRVSKTESDRSSRTLKTTSPATPTPTPARADTPDQNRSWMNRR